MVICEECDKKLFDNVGLIDDCFVDFFGDFFISYVDCFDSFKIILDRFFFVCVVVDYF